jgi:hypothetical protein
MASANPIRISVLCEVGTWLTRHGDVVRYYDSEAAAITAAIRRAQDFGRQGHFAAVVMRTLTSVYGPTGLIRTLPTRGRPMVQPDDGPVADEAEEITLMAEPAPSVVPAVDEPVALKSVVTRPVAARPVAKPPASRPATVAPTTVKPGARQPSVVEKVRQDLNPRPSNVDAIPVPAEIEPERPGRFMRIVAALAREAEDRSPAGRSFHQTISRLARSRRMPSLR